jgi:hypothetical protein
VVELTDDDPVTWTVSFGREPSPEATVSVNIRGISPYSATQRDTEIPAEQATEDRIHLT